MEHGLTDHLDKRNLFRYIGLAYDFTRSHSDVPLDGKADDFLGRLYRRRLGSVFGDLKVGREGGKANLHDLIGLVEDLIHWHKSEMLVGQVGDFHFDERGAEDRPRNEEIDGPDHQVEALGLEAYATYLPIHFFPGGPLSKSGWGIYISEEGVERLAILLREGYESKQYQRNPEAKATFRQVAFEVLLRHELEHFKIECFALHAEMYRREAVYVPYLQKVYAETFGSDSCLEEALANATVLGSRVIRKMIYDLYPKYHAAWWDVIAERFFDRQPAGYRNYRLERGWPGGARYTGPKSSDRRDAMNHLCNQIVGGEVRHDGEEIPFFAFPPDNYFLRAESLVPVYVIKTLDERRSFIHFQTPTKTDWERFLKKVGYEPTPLGKGRHEVWKSPNFGRITNSYHGKELDRNSFDSALKTLGISMAEFASFRNTKRIPEALAVRLNEREHEFAFQ